MRATRSETMISPVPCRRTHRGSASRMDKMVGNNKNLTARRRWSRTVSVPAECQISDGCVGSLCGCHAVCRNKATSTVVEDYTCECDSGFEFNGKRQRGLSCLRERAGLSWWKACVPVSCVDKINGYSCSSSPAYEERSSAEYV